MLILYDRTVHCQFMQKYLPGLFSAAQCYLLGTVLLEGPFVCVCDNEQDSRGKGQ